MVETAPFIIALVALVVAIFWIILKNASAKIEAQFEHLAKGLELELEIPAPKLAGFVRNEPAVFGTYRGREVSISVPGKGLQGTRQIETVLKIELRDKTLSAQFIKAGMMGKLGQRDSKGAARWKSGDEAFDDSVDVRSNHGERLSALLSSEDRVWISQTLKKYKPNIYIGAGVIAYTELGLIGNEPARERFEQAIEFLCDLAETVEAA